MDVKGYFEQSSALFLCTGVLVNAKKLFYFGLIDKQIE